MGMTLRKYLLLITGLYLALSFFTLKTGYSYQFSLITYTVRILCIAFILYIVLKSMMKMMRSERTSKFKNYILALATFFTLFMVLEVVFMFVPRTHGGDKTLASRVWYHYYWEHNSLWYRDAEPDSSEVANKFKIAVLGDSFVAGHGIKHVEDRFTDILQARLSDQYVVFNLGHNGAGTEDEFKQLLEFPFKPDLLILSHLPNDIAFIPTEPTKTGMLIPRFFIGGSYVLNYFVFKFEERSRRLYHTMFGGKATNEHEAHLKSGNADTYQLSFFLNPKMLEDHFKQLQKFIDHSAENDIQLAVMLFPEIWKTTLDFSEEHVNIPLTRFFENKGIHVFDTYNIFNSIAEKDRVVNFNDAHPSELPNRMIADSLYKKLVDWEMLPD